MKYILSIDQGTTSSRAILFNKQMKIEATSQEEFPQYFPNSGWVEHDPKDLYDTVINSCKNVLKKLDIKASDIISIGITNQRETTLVWDKNTGETVYNAIVWQDRRSTKLCDSLKKAGYEQMIREKTGLLLDPYFSGTKLKWILDNVEGAKEKANKGDLLFGTVDSYLIWKLTNGKNHVTDATNAARTLLFNINTKQWDEEICSLLQIPMKMLPNVKDCASDFGSTTFLGDSLDICGVAGDQQSAAIGQACFEKGMIKATYGTGCFALLNTGNKMVLSNNKLLSTIAYQLNGETTYALEGSIFVAGAVVQWLRDGLKIINDAKETTDLALKADPNQQLYIVPAFTGLGAPYWDTTCRGAIYGLTRGSGAAEFAKAALESVGYQTKDLFDAMIEDYKDSSKIASKDKNSILRVDGGMSGSDYTIQFLADILGQEVHRPQILETTALGVAWLAGMNKGFYPKKEDFSKAWLLDKKFEPTMSEDLRTSLYEGWTDSIKRTLSIKE